ncbi:MAG: phosphate ABC transporter permease PstA, partial [Mycobacteriaceae bacterium]
MTTTSHDLENRPHAALAPSGFSDISTGRKLRNNMATVIVYVAMGVAVVPLVWVLWVLIQKGLPVILSSDWWAYDMFGQLSNVAGGGISHAIIGTLTQALVTTLISVPV